MRCPALGVSRCAPARCWRVPLLLTALLTPSVVGAADEPSTEVRKFQISVDGERCGKFSLSIETRPDGREVVRSDAKLELKYLLYTFHYTSAGSETWHQGRLEKMDSAARYGASHYHVTAQAQGDNLLVKVGKKERKVRNNVTLTSYWREPNAKQVGTTLPLLDFDKGRSLSGKLSAVGSDPLEIRGEKQDCPHYRLTGDVTVDVWYDAAGRLVRQETVESGHRTRLELTEIHP